MRVTDQPIPSNWPRCSPRRAPPNWCWASHAAAHAVICGVAVSIHLCQWRHRTPSAESRSARAPPKSHREGRYPQGRVVAPAKHSWQEKDWHGEVAYVHAVANQVQIRVLLLESCEHHIRGLPQDVGPVECCGQYGCRGREARAPTRNSTPVVRRRVVPLFSLITLLPGRRPLSDPVR